MKTLTVNWLKKQRACEEAIKWFENQSLKNPIDIINHFIKIKEYLDWGNWLIVRLMKRKDKIRYAIFAAKQVLSIYEKKYPDDLRPRKAIEAAEKCLKYGSQKNKNIAYSAAIASHFVTAGTAVAASVDVTYSSAAYAAYAAYVAYTAAAAAAAIPSHTSAYTTVTSVAAISTAASCATGKKLQIKILKYGLTLLK